MANNVTAVIGIGNTDNKLTQADWSNFIATIDTVISATTEQVHFRGFSPGDTPWQNACWMVDITESSVSRLRNGLRGAGKRYRQDSVALIVGKTEFVETLPSQESTKLAGDTDVRTS